MDKVKTRLEELLIHLSKYDLVRMSNDDIKLASKFIRQLCTVCKSTPEYNEFLDKYCKPMLAQLFVGETIKLGAGASKDGFKKHLLSFMIRDDCIKNIKMALQDENFKVPNIEPAPVTITPVQKDGDNTFIDFTVNV